MFTHNLLLSKPAAGGGGGGGQDTFSVYPSPTENPFQPTSDWDVRTTLSYAAGTPDYWAISETNTNARYIFHRIDELDGVDLTDVADGEMLIRVTFSSDQVDVGCVFRGSITSEGESTNDGLVGMWIDTGGRRKARLYSKTYATLQDTGSLEGSGPMPTQNGPYFLRFRVTGDLMQLKTWLVSVPEPAAWLMERTTEFDFDNVTPITSNASGRLGLYYQDGNLTSQISYIGIGINGATAPMPGTNGSANPFDAGFDAGFGG